MKDKKYELTDNTIEYDGKTLYQIKALKNFGNVKTGYLGGYVEKEENLSHEGNCWVDDNAKVYNNAKISGNAEIYGNASVGDNAEVYDNTQVFGNAKVYGYAKVYGQAKISDKAKVYGNAEIFGASCWVYNNAEVYDNAKIYGEADVFGNAKVSGNAEVYGTAQVYDNTLVSGNTKIFDTENKKYEFVGGDINDVVEIENTKEIKVEILENEIQKYEEHCSKVVDKLKLQDELPNFQVISQKGVLYEKNSENNNISEIKNFVENLKGEEFWDNMSLKDIRDWKELRNDEVVTIVYESKDDRDNITLEEFTDYNDYAKDTVKNALEKEFKNNPDTIESLKKDILDKVPNKEVVKEKVEVVKDIEKEEKATNKTFGYRGDF